MSWWKTDESKFGHDFNKDKNERIKEQARLRKEQKAAEREAYWRRDKRDDLVEHPEEGSYAGNAFKKMFGLD